MSNGGGRTKPLNALNTLHQYWTVPGTYQYIVPYGVRSMTGVVIGSGVASDGPANSVGGRAGSVAWADHFAVTPGETLTIRVGDSSILKDGISITANAGGGGGVSTIPGSGFKDSVGMYFSSPQYTGAYTNMINTILPKNLNTYGIGGTSQTRTDGAVILIPNTDQLSNGAQPYTTGRFYNVPGTYTLTLPPDVINVKAVCVSGPILYGSYSIGGWDYPASYVYSGMAGSTVWTENFDTTPGGTYTIKVGDTAEVIHRAAGFDPNVRGKDSSISKDNTGKHMVAAAGELAGDILRVAGRGYASPEIEFRSSVGEFDNYFAFRPNLSSTSVGRNLNPGAYGGNMEVARQKLVDFRAGMVFGAPTPASMHGAVYVEFTTRLPVADNQIINADKVTTFAGGNVRALADGGPIQSYAVDGITRDATNNVIYLADSDYHRIRKMVFNAEVGWQSSTLAGSPARTPGFSDSPRSNARFNLPSDACFSNNVIYVADTGNHVIRLVTPNGLVTTLAGNGVAGYKDGHVSTAQFNRPQSVSVDKAGIVYVADTGNGCVRRIVESVVSTYADGFNAPTKAYIGANEKLYVSDSDGVYLVRNYPYSASSSYQVFSTPGNYTIQVPVGCINVKVICISAGQSTRNFTSYRWIDNGNPFSLNDTAFDMDIPGIAGTTAWTNSFPFTPGQTFNVVVGDQNNPTSSFGDGDSRLSVNTSVTATVPFASSAGQSGLALHSRALGYRDSNPPDWTPRWVVRIRQPYGDNQVKITLRAGVYSGNSTIAGPLIGQAGYVIPPDIEYSTTGTENSTNNPGLVYVEFTYAL